MYTKELTYAQNAILNRIKDKMENILIYKGGELECRNYNEAYYGDSYEDSNGSYYSDAAYRN